MSAFRRSDLPELQIFLTIARRRSFAQAAKELGLTTSALSRAMQKLEDHLGVRLLHRAPTLIGKRLAQRLDQGFETIAKALGEIETFRENPVGELRINIPHDAGRLLIGPILPAFVAAYPQVELIITAEDGPVDIIAEGFDLGVRYGGTAPEDMVAVALTPLLRWVVIGSPEYLQQRGYPQTPADLLNHDCIRMRLGDNSVFKWELGDGDDMVRLEVQGPLAANDTETTVDAARRGVGLGYVLERRAQQEVSSGALEIVLPDWASTGPAFFAYYASRKQTEPGLRQIRRFHLVIFTFCHFHFLLFHPKFGEKQFVRPAIGKAALRRRRIGPPFQSPIPSRRSRVVR
ncbi:LysR family transcriptional regulator [Rhodoblastus sp.]|uniref:LysR family transcriptional regulator n=1 Tax=Rhodoblastus sp. TaxID=1962975 RepID=UPI003F9DB4A4